MEVPKKETLYESWLKLEHFFDWFDNNCGFTLLMEIFTDPKHNRGATNYFFERYMQTNGKPLTFFRRLDKDNQIMIFDHYEKKYKELYE